MYENVRGVVPPIVTPLNADGTLDRKGLERLLEFQLNSGVHGIFALGTSGEAYVHSDKTRAELVMACGEIVNKRVPYFVGVGDTSRDRTLANGEAAAKAGADYVYLINPPFLTYAMSERVKYIREMAARMPVPVMIYNIPQVNGNPLDAAALEELMDAPNIAGVKDSESNGMKNNAVLAVLHKHPHFRWFEGNDWMSGAHLLMGAHGIVNGGINLYPKLYLELYDAASKRDVPRLHAVQQRLVQALKVMRLDAGHSSDFGSFVKCVKYALSLRGIIQEHCAYPHNPLSAETKKQVERLMADLAE